MEKLYSLSGNITQEESEEQSLWGTHQSGFSSSYGNSQKGLHADSFGIFVDSEEACKVHEFFQKYELLEYFDQTKRIDSTKNRHPKKPGRKPECTGLTCRKDVAFKTLLRSIRRFHWEKLKIHTQFTTKKKQSKSECDTFLGEYIQKELGVEPNQEFISTLNLYLFSEKSRPGKANNLYRDVLFRYSAAKLDKCLENRYFRCLIYYYIFESGPQISDSDSKIAIKMMEKKCNNYEALH